MPDGGHNRLCIHMADADYVQSLQMLLFQVHECPYTSFLGQLSGGHVLGLLADVRNQVIMLQEPPR